MTHKPTIQRGRADLRNHVGWPKRIGCGLLMMGFASIAGAQVIANGGFEEPSLADGTSGTVIGWSSGTAINPDASGHATGFGTLILPQPASGQQYLRMGEGGGGIQTGVSQSFTVTELGRYAVVWSDNSTLTRMFMDTAPYTINISGPSVAVSASLDAYHGGIWKENALSAVLAPGTYFVGFSPSRVPQGRATGFIDDVRIVAVPEPATALLLLAGAGVLASRRRQSAQDFSSV